MPYDTESNDTYNHRPVPSLTGKIFFVTGGSGFVGSNLVHMLCHYGAHVLVLMRGKHAINLTGLEIQPVHGDLHTANYEQALRGVDGVFHVAADYRLWAKNPQEIYHTNVEGTKKLMRACIDANIKRVVYTSSVATLGTIPQGTHGSGHGNKDDSRERLCADEETPVSFDDMVGDYKKSKFLAEEETQQLVAKEGLQAIIVNPSAPVGGRDRRPTATGRMILEAASGRMPAYVESGLNIVHVEDVAMGHILAWEKGIVGRRYILGGENMKLGAIFRTAAKLGGHRGPFVRLPRHVLMPFAYINEALASFRHKGYEPLLTVTGVKLAKKHMFFSSQRAVDELGYAPRPAIEAIQTAVAWFRRNNYLPT
ncbi:MAG: NAD-dependent epimerase/dehydratase family protein [Alphaproteobacteria bacterium GM7ARS4]|nr:NAD-dependent epimerase/dehydratase family protein [Alphaproteobacteria bacterium GM7ARS4]